MAFFQYDDLQITAMSACLPKRKIDNRTFSDFFSDEDVEKVIKMTGIECRRWADQSMLPSDLAVGAVQKLLADNQLSTTDIDALVVCSVTPDLRIPASSFIIQAKLGLPKDIICFDINIGCSGYIYALNAVYSLMAGQQIARALLVNIHVVVNNISMKDKATSLLFGDGATATLIEKVGARTNSAGRSYFSLQSDGTGYDAIIKPGGGYRSMSSEDTLRDKLREDGSVRTDESPCMDGPRVFDFTITEVPKDIKLILDYAGKAIADIDHYVFHQANLFIIKHISKKLKIPMEKIPLSLDKYGNLSSTSLPLTIVSELREALRGKEHTVLLTGFGVGLSWGSAVLTMGNTRISEIVEL